MSGEHRPSPHTVGRFVLVALILPAVLTLIAIVVQLMMLPMLPDTVASHWTASGTADGFAPSWLNPLMTAVLGLGIPALLALAALPGLRRGDRGTSYRLLGALSAATSVLMATLLTWTLVIQLGLDDVADATLPFWPTMVVIMGLTVGSGVAAWFAQPRDYPQEPVVPGVVPLDLEPGERAVWMRTVSIARTALITMVLAVILVTGLAVGSWVVGATTGVSWVLTGAAALLIALTATTACFHVRVDADGLHVESVLGVPRFRVPLESVDGVAAVEVNPMGDFGGWGLRLGLDGRFGVVLRTGPALQVARRGKRTLVVTVDDAETAAALLEALVERRATGEG